MDYAQDLTKNADLNFKIFYTPRNKGELLLTIPYFEGYIINKVWDNTIQ